ncbi:hypothetical protein D1BOALGB6SA_8551 [Olavius sp. associated proteobacterium Delta 1]|nr:hypothetical protein D1BOALGB6SA_8551 [Olavius sp. associated proteobacterium Delta 1]
MRISKTPPINEAGIVTGMMLFMLAIFTVVAVAAAVISIIEMQIASNDQYSKTAFYSAEAARSYVPTQLNLYGAENTIKDSALNFPNGNDASEKTAIGANQKFNGDVMFLGSSVPPRGSGYEVGTFNAHRYQMTCNGYGPRKSTSRIEAGFYRIGL